MAKAFKNTSNQSFTIKWNGVTKVIKPGQTYVCDTEYEAMKHAKDLAYTVLNSEIHKEEKEALKKGLNIKTKPITQSQLRKKMQEFLVDIDDVRIS
ncbi:MAG: hypothetical protein D6711_03810 [Chloroflexi bacterium]|nr:MAG: hypothetical protein D6711_03810 [Chloroflexota bacterium]